MKKKNTGLMLLVLVVVGFVVYTMMDTGSGCTKGCGKGCGNCKGCSKGCGKCKGCRKGCGKCKGCKGCKR